MSKKLTVMLSILMAIALASCGKTDNGQQGTAAEKTSDAVEHVKAAGTEVQAAASDAADAVAEAAEEAGDAASDVYDDAKEMAADAADAGAEMADDAADVAKEMADEATAAAKEMAKEAAASAGAAYDSTKEAVEEKVKEVKKESDGG